MLRTCVVIDTIRAQVKVAEGLSFICSMCERYWEGRARGLPGDACTSLAPCGGPMSYGTFEHYKGPITEFLPWCFVCGEKSTHAVDVPRKTRRLGVCRKHVELVRTMGPAVPAADSGHGQLAGAPGVPAPGWPEFGRKVAPESALRDPTGKEVQFRQGRRGLRVIA